MNKLRKFNDYNHTISEKSNGNFPSEVPESQYESIDGYLESLNKTLTNLMHSAWTSGMMSDDRKQQIIDDDDYTFVQGLMANLEMNKQFTSHHSREFLKEFKHF